jgi:alanine dehydrogenase
MKLAKIGASEAIRTDLSIREGVNTYHGHITYKAVAQSQNKEWKPVSEVC